MTKNESRGLPKYNKSKKWFPENQEKLSGIGLYIFSQNLGQDYQPASMPVWDKSSRWRKINGNLKMNRKLKKSGFERTILIKVLFNWSKCVEMEEREEVLEKQKYQILVWTSSGFREKNLCLRFTGPYNRLDADTRLIGTRIDLIDD